MSIVHCASLSLPFENLSTKQYRRFMTSTPVNLESSLPITAHVGDERHSEGTIRLHTMNSSQRMGQALKKLAMFWGIALFSILIPVFHFVTVPLFFCLGVFFFYRGYKSEGVVLGGEVSCPHCNQKVTIKPTAIEWPLSEICQSCARVLRIQLVQR